MLQKSISGFKHSLRISLPIILLTGLGACIRLINLNQIILYWDEPMHCIRIAYQPLKFVLAQNDMSAFLSVLVHFLLGLGKIETMARLPSLIAGVLAIPVVYLLGKHLISKSSGWLAAFFVTLSPLLIQYSQYSRMYAIYLVFSVASLTCFYRAVTEDKTGFWVGYLVFTVLGIYNHLFSFLLLPVFGMYTGITWLRNGFRKKGKQAKPFQAKILFKFAGWTLLALLIVTLLYLPDSRQQEFLFNTVDRAVEPGAQAPTFSLLKTVIIEQFRAVNDTVLFLSLFLALIGFITLLRQRFWQASLMALYIFLPFITFLLIKPSLPSVLSAFRYFLFFLPIIYLCMGQGILLITGQVGKYLASQSNRLVRKIGVQNWAALLLAILLVYFTFNLKDYYTDYWRLGRQKIDRQVQELLENEVRRDSLIYFNQFPLSSHLLAMNPLTKDLQVGEIETVFRTSHQAPPGKNDIMIFSIGLNHIPHLAQRNIDFWLVTKNEKSDQLEKRGISIINAGHSVFHLDHFDVHLFHDRDRSLAENMTGALAVLNNVIQNPADRKDFFYFSARTKLLQNQIVQAIADMQKARQVKLSSVETSHISPSFFYRILDSLMGTNPAELQRKHEVVLEKNLAFILLRKGDELRRMGKTEQASQIYDLSSELDPDLNRLLSNRIAMIANRFYRRGETQTSTTFYRKALSLNPGRKDLRFLLGDSLLLSGHKPMAFKEWSQTFGIDTLNSDTYETISTIDPVLIIWKEGGKWNLLFRSRLDLTLSGRINAGNKIKEPELFLGGKRDTLQRSAKSISFNLVSNQGMVKGFTFRLTGYQPFKIDILNSKRMKPGHILLLNQNSSPDQIPFLVK